MLNIVLKDLLQRNVKKLEKTFKTDICNLLPYTQVHFASRIEDNRVFFLVLETIQNKKGWIFKAERRIKPSLLSPVYLKMSFICFYLKFSKEKFYEYFLKSPKSLVEFSFNPIHIYSINQKFSKLSTYKSDYFCAL